MKDFIASIANRPLRTNTAGTALHQTDRNAIGTETEDALQALLTVNEVPATQVKDGIAIEYEHAELGCITVVVSVTVKALDYDILTEAEAYEAEKVAKAEAKAKKEAETAKKKAEAEANKAKKVKATK